MSFPKKLIIIFTLLLLVSGYALPAFVFAQTEDNPCDNRMCWPPDECKKKNGIWAQTDSSTKICEAVVKCYKATYKKMPKETLAVVDSLGYCYAPPPDVNLQVSIGATNQVKGITDYIPKIYDYLVAIVSIVAIVMIMVGGLQYLTAGGNQQAVTKAKERILGAIVGLFLVLGAYTVLNTINPNLTKLSLPPIKMIRADALEGAQLSVGAECWTKRDKVACEASCEGCKCQPLCETNLEKVIKWTEIITIGGIALGGVAPVVGGGGVLTSLKTAGAAGLKYSWAGIKLAWKWKGTITTAAAAAAIWGAVTPDKGEMGVCFGTPNHSIYDWGACEEDISCQMGSKCINISGVLQSGTTASGEQCALLKLCSSGKESTPCAPTNPYCQPGLQCLDTFLAKMGVCGDPKNRPLFAICDNNHTLCKTGYCDPTSNSCATASGDVLKGSQCAGAYCKTSPELENNNGVCTSYSGITYLTNISKEDQETINTSDLSYCSNLYKKCYNIISWLVCEGKFSGGIYGKCLKAPTLSCQNDSECIYACDNSSCSQWPPKECEGYVTKK
ncbi:pilin [Patescibacteria group bacterium]|nr:pilin [Patescibacteria group bacterium]